MPDKCKTYFINTMYVDTQARLAVACAAYDVEFTPSTESACLCGCEKIIDRLRHKGASVVRATAENVIGEFAACKVKTASTIPDIQCSISDNNRMQNANTISNGDTI